MSFSLSEERWDSLKAILCSDQIKSEWPDHHVLAMLCGTFSLLSMSTIDKKMNDWGV